MKEKKHIYKFNYQMLTLNIFSMFLLFLMIAITCIFIKLGIFNLSDINKLPTRDTKDFSFFTVIIAIFFWFILHEIIHGISYLIMGAKWDKIKFGVALEKGILFCKCNDQIDKRNILVSIIAPFITIGVITYIIAIIFNLQTLLVLSVLNISGAAADIMLFFFFARRKSDITFTEINDSSTFILTTTEDLTNKKFISTKLVEELKEIPQDEIYNNKINISKSSKIVGIIMIILYVIALISFIK